MLASFILGLSFGSATINLFNGYHIDEMHIYQKELEEQLESSQSELTQLKKNLAEHKNKRLTNIDIHVSINIKTLTQFESEQIELEVIKSSKHRLSGLIGQEISKLNYYQIAMVLDGREITFNQQTFTQNVDLVVVTDHIDIHITVLPQKSLP